MARGRANPSRPAARDDPARAATRQQVGELLRGQRVPPPVELLEGRLVQSVDGFAKRRSHPGSLSLPPPLRARAVDGGPDAMRVARGPFGIMGCRPCSW